MGAVNFRTDWSTIPAEVVSGEYFRLIIWWRAELTLAQAQALLGPTTGIRSSDHYLICEYAGRQITLEEINTPDPGPFSHDLVYYNGGQLIEALAPDVFSEDRLFEIKFIARCIAHCTVYGEFGNVDEDIQLENYLTWTVNVVVPRLTLNLSQWILPPEVVKRDDPLSITFSFVVPHGVRSTAYVKHYVDCEVGGQRFNLWSREWEFGAGYWYSGDYLNVVQNIPSIESLVGAVTENRYYAIRFICGYVASGTIEGTDEAWYRGDEASVEWRPYVTVAPPAPNFLLEYSVQIPEAMDSDQEFTVILYLRNYGSSGQIYLDYVCGERSVELGRWNLAQGQDAVWQSGPITIDYFAGEITQSGEVQVVFNCGYIIDGVKYQVNSLPQPCDIRLALPVPDFVIEQCVQLPYSVDVDQTFDVLLHLRNYGSFGEIYLDYVCGERSAELGRWSLYKDNDVAWELRAITIEYFAGLVSESGEVQVVFNCGYVVEGVKHQVNSLPQPCYVRVPGTPPPPPPPPSESKVPLVLLGLAGVGVLVAASRKGV